MKRGPQRPRGPSLIERAIVEQQWHEQAVSAHIHALMGESGDELVNKAGRIFFVVLGAAIAEGVSHEQPEMRIIRGAVNATHDQAGEAFIPEQRRASILSGLEAAERIIPALERKSLTDAACDLLVRLRRQDILLSDFEALLK